jgi:hypothetical protein
VIDPAPGLSPHRLGLLVVHRRARRIEAALVGVFTLLVAWPFLRPDRFVLGYDTVTYGGPNLAVTFTQWKSGHVPTWNDSLFGGVYQLANSQAAVLYPVKLAFLPLRAGEALDLITATHLFLLAFGTWWLLARRLRVHAPAAALGAIVTVGGGLVMSRSLQFEQIAVLAWVPWVLGTLDRCLEPDDALPRRSRAIAVAAAATCLTMALIAGHPQQVFIAAPLIAAWVLMRLIDRNGLRPNRPMAVPVATVALSAMLGFGLAAAQLLPTALSVRQSASAGEKTLRRSADRAYAVEPGSIPSTILGPGTGDTPLASAGNFEAMTYVGAAAATLAVFGIAAGLSTIGANARHRRHNLEVDKPGGTNDPDRAGAGVDGGVGAEPGRSPTMWATTIGLVALGVVGLALAIGPRCSGPPDAFVCSSGGLAYRAGFKLIPGFGLARVPGRWLELTTVAIAVLSAMGLDAIVRRGLSRRAALGAVVATVAVGVVALVAPTELPGGVPASAPYVWAAIATIVLIVGVLSTGLVPVRALKHQPRAAFALGLIPLVLVAGELAWTQPHSLARQSLSPVAFDQLGGTTATMLAQSDTRVLSLAAQPFGDLPYLARAIKPNANATAGVRSIDGYDGGLQVTTEWATAMDPLTNGPFNAELPLGWQIAFPPNPGLLARSGVRYVLFDPVSVATGLGEPDPTSSAAAERMRRTFMAGWGQPVHTEGTIETFENPAFRGEALVYHRVEAVDVANRSDAEVRDALVIALGRLNPETTVVTTGQRGQAGSDADTALGVGAECTGDCTATVADVDRIRPGVVSVAVDNPASGLLVVPETAVPGWSATVDGRSVPIVTADARSLGVVVAAGQHDVRLVYDAPGLRAGAMVSALSGLVVIGLVGWGLAIRRRRRLTPR